MAIFPIYAKPQSKCCFYGTMAAHDSIYFTPTTRPATSVNNISFVLVYLRLRPLSSLYVHLLNLRGTIRAEHSTSKHVARAWSSARLQTSEPQRLLPSSRIQASPVLGYAAKAHQNVHRRQHCLTHSPFCISASLATNCLA